MSKKTMHQNAMIREHLEKYGSITFMEAIKRYSCTRLSARIYDLRKSGMIIETHSISGKNKYGQATRYACYTLEGTNG